MSEQTAEQGGIDFMKLLLAPRITRSSLPKPILSQCSLRNSTVCSVTCSQKASPGSISSPAAADWQ